MFKRIYQVSFQWIELVWSHVARWILFLNRTQICVLVVLNSLHFLRKPITIQVVALVILVTVSFAGLRKVNLV
jgi:hypothetical protein